MVTEIREHKLGYMTKGTDVRPVERVSKDGRTQWCPHCDYSYFGAEYTVCGDCGAVWTEKAPITMENVTAEATTAMIAMYVAYTGPDEKGRYQCSSCDQKFKPQGFAGHSRKHARAGTGKTEAIESTEAPSPEYTGHNCLKCGSHRMVKTQETKEEAAAGMSMEKCLDCETNQNRAGEE